jgi:hypothetical protein
MMHRILFLFLAVVFLGEWAPVQGRQAKILLDDFESYEDGALPVKWKAQLNGKLVPLTEQFTHKNESFYVKKEDGKQFVRAYSKGEAVHIALQNGEDLEWRLSEHPMLSWDWRANTLPLGGREDKDDLNDSGAGIYVMFSMEGIIIRRPKAIKYVYSSTLPEGTVVTYGKLKVIVVSSNLDGIGMWKTITRDVAADYKEVFGGNPPDKPMIIRLWSDSDNTKSEASSDFDNIQLLRRF